jgi:hypothetical protein
MPLRSGSPARQRGRALAAVLLLVLAGVLLYLSRAHWLEWLPPGWRATLRSATGQPSAVTEAVRIYAWQDDAGQWQYTDQPPADRPFEVRQSREDTNVVPAFERPEE